MRNLKLMRLFEEAEKTLGSLDRFYHIVEKNQERCITIAYHDHPREMLTERGTGASVTRGRTHGRRRVQEYRTGDT